MILFFQLYVWFSHCSHQNSGWILCKIWDWVHIYFEKNAISFGLHGALAYPSYLENVNLIRASSNDSFIVCSSWYISFSFEIHLLCKVYPFSSTAPYTCNFGKCSFNHKWWPIHCLHLSLNFSALSEASATFDFKYFDISKKKCVKTFFPSDNFQWLGYGSYV